MSSTRKLVRRLKILGLDRARLELHRNRRPGLALSEPSLYKVRRGAKRSSVTLADICLGIHSAAEAVHDDTDVDGSKGGWDAAVEEVDM